MDASHVYVASAAAISCVDESGQVSTVLPSPADANQRAFIRAFALDATSVYANRRVTTLDGTFISEGIVRAAKDGSEATTLYERPSEQVTAISVDDTHIYFVVSSNDSCSLP